MLLKLKIYLIGGLYFFGAAFMFSFPPRNFSSSGSKIPLTRDLGNDLQFPEYLDYELIKSTMEMMAQNESQVAKMVYLSRRTSQNRSILALELKSDYHSKKPGIVIIGGINGMAWATPNAILELAWKLMYDSKYQSPFFNDYDWYLIPLANPDGMAYTQHLSTIATINNSTQPAPWFKNVDSEDDTSACLGTNVNRNFAFHWQDDVKKTPTRCSQTYPGSKPFSSAEASAIRDYLGGVGDSIEMAIHLQASYVPKKEYILYPWRYTIRQQSHYKQLQKIGEYAARYARLPNGRIYEVHQSGIDYHVAGSLIDYIAGVVGIDLAFLLKPYFKLYPDISDTITLETFVKQSLASILGLVRGWRSSNKLNTLYFLRREVEF